MNSHGITTGPNSPGQISALEDDAKHVATKTDSPNKTQTPTDPDLPKFAPSRSRSASLNADAKLAEFVKEHQAQLAELDISMDLSKSKNKTHISNIASLPETELTAQLNRFILLKKALRLLTTQPQKLSTKSPETTTDSTEKKNDTNNIGQSPETDELVKLEEVVCRPEMQSLTPALSKLLNSGIETKGQDGKTPIHRYGHGAEDNLMLACFLLGANVNALTEKGGGNLAHQTALCKDPIRDDENSCKELVQRLVIMGVDFTHHNKDDNNPSQVAQGSGHFELAEILAPYCDPDKHKSRPYLPSGIQRLMQLPFSEVKKTKVKNWILENKGNLHAANANGGTLLHIAAANGLGGIVEFLLENGAQPDIKNDKKKAPLVMAKKEKIQKMLISAAQSQVSGSSV